METEDRYKTTHNSYNALYERLKLYDFLKPFPKDLRKNLSFLYHLIHISMRIRLKNNKIKTLKNIKQENSQKI